MVWLVVGVVRVLGTRGSLRWDLPGRVEESLSNASRHHPQLMDGPVCAAEDR